DASSLEFIRDQILRFRSSRFCQQVDIRVGQNTTMVYSETISAGRTASGEIFDFDIFFLKMAVRDCKGHLLFADAAKLEPGRDDLAGLFGRKSIWSMIYVNTPDFEGIHKLINAAIEEDKSILA